LWPLAIHDGGRRVCRFAGSPADGLLKRNNAGFPDMAINPYPFSISRGLRGFALIFKIALFAGAGMAMSGCAVTNLGSMFGGGSQGLVTSSVKPVAGAEKSLSMAAADMAPTPIVAGGPGSCPPISIWNDNSQLTIYEIGRVGDNLAIKHRAEITKMARECDISPSGASVKYGVAGRVLLGPMGSAGTVTLPLIVNVANSAGEKVASRKVKVRVSIKGERPYGNFSIVENLSFPLKAGEAASGYHIYVSFDHNAPGAG
jgi:hypothetical protein